MATRRAAKCAASWRRSLETEKKRLWPRPIAPNCSIWARERMATLGLSDVETATSDLSDNEMATRELSDFAAEDTGADAVAAKWNLVR